MPCGWEGNRRSVVALAMRHRLQWFIHLRAHGTSKGDEVWHLVAFFDIAKNLPYFDKKSGNPIGLSRLTR